MNAFNRVALQIFQHMNPRISASDKDAEWQRVNSYIADILKDAHVLYAKLARVQGDFAGSELEDLEKISEDVLNIGGKLSAFSKAFYEGKVNMNESEAYGESDGDSESASMMEFSPSDDSEESDESESKSENPDSGEEADVDLEFDYEASPKDKDKEESD